MWWLGLVTGFVGQLFLARAFAWWRSRERLVNVIDGVVLPLPNDPRWIPGMDVFCPLLRHSDHHPQLSIGNVAVVEEHGVEIKGVGPVDGSSRYAKAVFAACKRRRLEEAAEQALLGG